MAVTGCGGPEEGRVQATLNVSEALGGGSTEGYARAVEPRTFRFPEDQGPHPDFRTEWWYFTGNLETAGGRRFGYQLTFFRSALAPEEPGLESPWSTRQAWMAHFALSDPAGGGFQSFERFDRGAVGLAGARAVPFRVWIGDWEARGPGEGAGAGEGGAFPMTLRARAGGVEIDLVVEPEKPRVLQGEAGLSRKGPEPGNASYYVSWTRLSTRGRVTTPEGSFPVNGASWLDREWSTSVLPEGVVGWDWFALQLDDARDLMVYGLREEDGGRHPFSKGVIVGPDGASRVLPVEAFDIEVTDRWTSPRDGSVYPVGWRVRVPDEGLDLRVDPVLDDQELDLAFRYWEGAVDVTPAGGMEGPSGRGYVELTGYAGRGPPAR
jgi:predicted secreted hydrolase